MTHDVIVVGGGPAGLSAALVLGRSRRKVLVCDSGHYRNECSRGVHGFFTRDRTPPTELLHIGREQLQPYQIELRVIEVTQACMDGERFRVTLADGAELFSRKLLLATGVKDLLPDVPGVTDFYGTSIHHCPYCDGWEWRDQPLAVYGRKRHGYALAVALLNWSKDVVLVTDGPAGLNVKQKRDLARLSVTVRSEPVTKLEGRQGMLERIIFESGAVLERQALFFSTGQDQCCDLATKFGCVLDKGTVRTGRKGETNVRGLYVVGDASHDVQFVIVAAAEGAKAGIAIHEALRQEELRDEFGRHDAATLLAKG